MEVQFNITFNTPFTLGPDHVFFRPEVNVGDAGDFFWLSAPKPIVPPGTPFAADLQSWIRNDGTGALAPDWERIGTDVTGQGPFNAAFSLTGVSTIPEPSTWCCWVLLAWASHCIGRGGTPAHSSQGTSPTSSVSAGRDLQCCAGGRDRAFYQQLARDAYTSGDLVAAEAYHQYAEHYSRLVAEQQRSRSIIE